MWNISSRNKNKPIFGINDNTMTDGFLNGCESTVLGQTVRTSTNERTNSEQPFCFHHQMEYQYILHFVVEEQQEVVASLV